MEPPSRVDLLLRRIKDNRFLSVLIVIGIVCLGLISFVEGLQKAGQVFGFGQSRAAYDVHTKESIIATAKKVDSLLLEIETSNKAVFLQDVQKQFLEVEAELRSLLLRNEVQALNDEAVTIAKLQLDQWTRVREQLKLGMNPSVAALTREIMATMFRSQLMVEVMRHQ